MVKNRDGQGKKRTVAILHSEVHKDWGGEPIRVFDEAIGMAERGYRVVIAAPADSELIKKASGSGLCTEPVIMKKWISYPYSLLKAIRIIKKFDIDIINTHASYDSWVFSIASKLLGKKLLRTRHMSFFGTDLTSRLIYRLPDFIITTSLESGRNELINHFSLSPERVMSVPSGPDLEKFDPDNPGNPAETFGIKPGDKVVGMVAAIRKSKGHIYFINSMTRIIEKSGHNVRFLIVGNGNYPAKEKLMKRVADLGITDRCAFTSHRDDVAEMLSLMDIFVFPSISEGTPQVLLQAMAMRLPVVACPVGGITELMGLQDPPDFSHSQNYQTDHGILIPPKDSEALADAVIHLIGLPGLCEEIGLRNREHVMKNYSRKIMLDKVESVYKGLLLKD
jgi:glycosyltransferase involved in cell wall biosynthesis